MTKGNRVCEVPKKNTKGWLGRPLASKAKLPAARLSLPTARIAAAAPVEFAVEVQ